MPQKIAESCCVFNVNPVAPRRSHSVLPSITLQVPNGVIISADDPDSSVFINQCSFLGSSVNTTTGATGMGGVVYATGSLFIANSQFESNQFWSTVSSSETNSSYSMNFSYTPSPFSTTAPIPVRTLPAGIQQGWSNRCTKCRDIFSRQKTL